jgi:hypothetical protein
MQSAITVSALVRRVIMRVKNSGNFAQMENSLDFIQQKIGLPAEVDNPLRYTVRRRKSAILPFKYLFHRGNHFVDSHRLHATEIETAFP